MRRIDLWYDTIKRAEAGIEAIRAKCPHTSFRIGWYSWRIGARDPQRLCDECDAIVPGLTEEESAKLVGEEVKLIAESMYKPETGTFIKTEENN